MLARQGWLWVRLLALIALFSSAALTVDYVTSVASFCGASGCEAVRESGFGYLPLGGVRVPLPAFGIIGFSLLLGCTLLPNREQSRRLTLLVATLGGAVGLLFILLQAVVIGEFCGWCLVADSCAVLAGLLAVMVWRSPREIQEPALWGYRLKPWAWGALAVWSVGVPLVWPSVKLAPPVPAGVDAAYVPGKVTIVEFVDFECPHCRRLHAILSALIERADNKPVIVRRHVPLAQHPYAEFAARAAVCAEGTPREEKLADFLFTTQDLSQATIRDRVVSLGNNVVTWDTCLRSAAVDQRLKADRAFFDSVGLTGLPSTYIGAWSHSGVASEEAYEEAILRAESGEGARGLSVTWFATLCSLGLGILLIFGKVRTLEGI